MYNVANNARSWLSADISSAVTSFSVADGSRFPTQNFLVSIDDEILRVNSRSGNVFSGVARGMEGTTAAAHAANSAVDNRFTAGTLWSLMDAIDAIDGVSIIRGADGKLKIGTIDGGEF